MALEVRYISEDRVRSTMNESPHIIMLCIYTFSVKNTICYCESRHFKNIIYIFLDPLQLYIYKA